MHFLITRETDYAIRCILYLSEHKNNTKNINEISKHTYIPKAFLSKIVQILVKNNILSSIKGKYGGVKLVKEPEKINLLDIIKIIQGDISMNICVIDNKLCKLSNTCSVHPVWIEIKKDIEKRLKKEDIKKLLSYKKK